MKNIIIIYTLMLIISSTATADIASRKFSKYKILHVKSSNGKLFTNADKYELFDDLVLNTKKNRKYTKFNYTNYENKTYTSLDCRSWVLSGSANVNTSNLKGTLLTVASRLYVGDERGAHYRVLDSYGCIIEQGTTASSYLDLTALKSGLYMIIVGDKIFKIIK